MTDSNVLERIDTALACGMYGRCVDCDHDIADRRLRLQASPFAMRCQACEHRREQPHGRAGRLARRRDRLSLGTVVFNS